MSNTLILDIECLTSNNGNPFDNLNKCVCVGLKWINGPPMIQYSDLKTIQCAIDAANLIVGFNIKFDLHWLRKINIDISKVKVWDCQLAHFLLNNQKTPYPSLNDVAAHYKFPPKIDNIALNYWDKGIDTDLIPQQELSEYLIQDLWLTEQIYLKQKEELKEKGLYPLFKLQCDDLLVLREIEYNGLKFNTEKALDRAEKIDSELKTIQHKLTEIIGGIPFNPNSNDHVSAILYGGNIVEDVRVPVGIFKTGNKVGETRYKIITKIYELPRIAEPLRGTEVKKPEGSQKIWKVNEPILRSLKLNKKGKIIVDLLGQYGKLEKLYGTYLIGYSNLIKKMNWEKDTLHGTFNQCVAVTGRLTSTKPNQQNIDPETKLYFESRYMT